MRIAILVLLFPPRWLAGTEIATSKIARHLAQRGHDVHVVTSLDDGLPPTELEQGFRVHRVSAPRVRFMGIIVFWLKALLLLRRLRPDLVHSQNLGMGAPAFLGKKLWRRPYVVWGQGTDVYLPWLFKRAISRPVLGNADSVIGLTEDMRARLQEMCPRDVEVIPNGIDLESYEGLPLKAAARAQLALCVDEKIIAFVGTLLAIKGLRYLVEAMRSVRREDATARLVLVGDGVERQRLELLVRERGLGDCVTFVGRVYNDVVPHYLAASDVFVLPSLSEGFPVTILEAMAAGAPIVASRVRGLPEIVEEGQNGFLVEPGSPEQLADRILLLLGDDDLRARISANNREKAKAYSWESVVDRLEEVYQVVVQVRK